jgi:hypothetical protein
MKIDVVMLCAELNRGQSTGSSVSGRSVWASEDILNGRNERMWCRISGVVRRQEGRRLSKR